MTAAAPPPPPLRSAVVAGGQHGQVYDRGYRPYAGPPGTRARAALALYRASVRRALGLRRSWRQKVAPWGLLAVATVPAIVNVGIAFVTSDTPIDGFRIITHRQYVGVSSALLVFVALTAPDALCPDRRNRVLPLLFSRPLTGRDYALSKLAAITSLVFAFGLLPHVVLFVGQMLVADGIVGYVADHAAVLWQVPVAVAALALFHGAIGLAVAAWTSRRVVAAGVYLLALLASSVVSGVLTEASNPERSGWAVLNLIALPLYVRDLVFLGHVDPTSPLGEVSGGGILAAVAYLAVVGGGVAALLSRYRWAER